MPTLYAYQNALACLLVVAAVASLIALMARAGRRSSS